MVRGVSCGGWVGEWFALLGLVAVVAAFTGERVEVVQVTEPIEPVPEKKGG